jgi:hypothetical protein
MVLLIVVGLYRHFTGTFIVQNTVSYTGFPEVSVFLLLRAFSSGCAALTGVEAISNGVPAFRPPESENAAITLKWMAVILAALFLGITFLSFATKIVPTPQETVIPQLARSIFGTGPLYFMMQASTALILLLATNTSFADFPRLASVMARDGFFPRQFALIGDKLVFTNGIIFLAAITSVVIAIFGGSTHHLIPLYAVGVFLSFTLSQSGMVKHWLLLGGPQKHHIFINAIGALVTAVVLVIVLTTKFRGGAWVIAVLIPVLVYVFKVIHWHYTRLGEELRLDPQCNYEEEQKYEFSELVVVPIAGLNKSVLNSIRYATSISDNVVAVHVATNEIVAEKTKTRWQAIGRGLPLKILPSPYRSLFGPLMAFLSQKREELNRIDPKALLIVVVPEFVFHHWWEYLLHSETAVILKFMLRSQQNIVVCSVPFQISNPKRAK